MQKRQLGYTDLKLTTVGLGTWAIGGPWQFGWGPQDDDESIATILKALELGINWLDTAPIYGYGHSETIVGKALRQTSQKPLIATKCGLIWDRQKPFGGELRAAEPQRISRLKKKSIAAECDASLKRLGIETIDLYQIHWPEPDEDIEQAAEAMAKLIEQGKVRYIGVSNFNIEQIERIRKIHPVASLQPPYSMLHREAEDELLDYCARNNIGVIAYSPLQRGLLTGKFSQQRLAGLPPDDHRRRNPDFQEPLFSATLELVEKLREIAARSGKTCAQLAISWILRRPAETVEPVTAAIVGARRPDQITETAPASDWTLTDDDIAAVEELLKQHKK